MTGGTGRRGRLLAPGIVALLASACATVNEAPVVERSSALVIRPAAPGAPSHLVVAGDTLYGIAFRHGLDYRQLAAWNDLSAPFVIRPGQRLRLAPPTRAGMAPDREAAAVAPAPVPAPAERSASRRPATVSASGVETYAVPDDAVAAPASGFDSVTAMPAGPAPPVPASGSPAAPAGGGARRLPSPGVAAAPMAPAARLAPATVPATPTPAPSGAAAPDALGNGAVIPPAPERVVAGIRWRWPATGRISSRHVADDPARQGIDIDGTAGDPVRAAADGEVVYSGNGLIGYGELIIIQHSGEYLSAYGHNRRRLVVEGQRVRAGELIAEMGRTGAAVDQLHFEIRRAGRPVDPLGFLPPR